MNNLNILVAEDDHHIRQGLIDILESEGYTVHPAEHGDEALRLWREQDPDPVLLDVMMPGRSGYDVCREIRKSNTHLPIIMLTAKGEEIDKVLGLELGADDYVTKPFGVRELLARIAAVIRRSRQQPEAEDPELPDRFELGSAVVDRKTFTVQRGRTEHPLTARELKLLELFYLHPGEVLSRDHLLNEAWGIEYYGTTRTLDQHIAQLRKKVEKNPAKPTVILTVHGVGYRLAG